MSGWKDDCRAGGPLQPLQIRRRQHYISGLGRLGRDKRLTASVTRGVQQQCEIEHVLRVRLDRLIIDLMLIDRSAEIHMLFRVDRGSELALRRIPCHESETQLRRGDGRPQQNESEQERNNPRWHGIASVLGGRIC